MERWQHIEALFQDALQRPRTEQEAYLREACNGDPELHREVASLLINHESEAFEPWAAAAASRLIEAAALLEPGARLGPYEVISFLAAGGMGAVYRARDTRLGRVVAIKVLSRGLTAGAAAVERFQQEARAASALNHPHICTIHDIGTAPPFIAMELLEGETLQRRLIRGPLETRTLVETALQLSDALAAAHAAGILHRDIKPANIFLAAHGPKILDFGLAKAAPDFSAAAASSHAWLQPTRSAHLPLTDSGVTVGTVAYMSPEQLRGEHLDVRTDLFSAGLVLYEMATGRAAFSGSTSAVISAAILHDQPMSPRQLRPELPPALEHIILKALEKDRDLRYQSASEVRADLRRLKRESDPNRTAWAAAPAAASARVQPHGVRGDGAEHPADRPDDKSAVPTLPASAAGGSDVPSDRSTPKADSSSDAQIAVALVKRHRGLAAVSALVVALVLAIGAYVVVFRKAQQAGLIGSLQDAKVVQLTRSGIAAQPSISADGKYVAYVENSGDEYSLWIRQTVTTSTVRIVPPERGVLLAGPTPTPDGGYVDYLRSQASIGPFPDVWRVPFLGGMPRKLIDNVITPVGWSPDGRQMAFARADFGASSSFLIVAEADGSHERVLATRRLPAFYSGIFLPRNPILRPAWSPDGRTIALVGANETGGVLSIQVVFVDVATGAERTVSYPSRGAGGGLAWVDRASLLLTRAVPGSPGQLLQLSYPDGKFSPLTNDLTNYRGVSLTADRSSLATTRLESRTGLWMGDGAGHEWSQTVPPAPLMLTATPSVAWAGDRVLYSTEASIARVAPGLTPPEPIVLNPGGGAPAATSDGRLIVYVTNETGRESGIWRVDGDGRAPRQLVDGNAFSPVITHDDRTVIFSAIRSDSPNSSLWAVSIDGGTPTPLVDNVIVGQDTVDVSPDGRSLFFGALEDQKRPIGIVCDLPGCTNRRRVPVPGNASGPRVRWTPDGKSIAYIAAGQGARNLWVAPLDGSSPPRPFTSFTDDYLISDFAWSRDGQRLAIARSRSTSDIVLFKGLRK